MRAVCREVSTPSPNQQIALQPEPPSYRAEDFQALWFSFPDASGTEQTKPQMQTLFSLNASRQEKKGKDCGINGSDYFPVLLIWKHFRCLAKELLTYGWISRFIRSLRQGGSKQVTAALEHFSTLRTLLWIQVFSLAAVAKQPWWPFSPSY